MALTPHEMTLRFDELVRGVVAPLILGGRIEPARPFGPRLGLAIGEGRTVADSDLRSQLDVARVRIARLFAPVDTVNDLTPEDFALAAAFNDLVQVSNQDLSGPFTRARHTQLLDAAVALATAVPRPRTIAEALSRHTVFARAFEVTRTDTTISWWTGSASFRGRPAPSRLMLWRDLRRVREDTRRIPLVEMSTDIAVLPGDAWLDALNAWIARSPLTDLATAARRAPSFRWADPTLSLISTVPGRTLAFRALARQRQPDVTGALERATAALPAESQAARELCVAFLQEISSGFAAFTKKTAA